MNILNNAIDALDQSVNASQIIDISYANAHSEITELMLKLYMQKGEDYEQSICSSNQ
jgi:hypothetical protein